MIGIGSAANPFPPRYPLRSLKMKMSDIGPFSGPVAAHVIAAASSRRLTEHLASSLKKLIHVGHVPRLKDVWLENPINFERIDFLQLLKETISSTCSSIVVNFSGGADGRINKASSVSANSTTKSPNRRQWTNVILALNILVYVGQLATKGKLLYWGAKINSLIDKGQIWRLVTSSFLHANVMHLMVNCYSLNSVGPTVEAISGPRRFLAVYFSSAVASAAISYWCNKAPAIGASGAIFGLVGSVAVFTLRHRGLIGGGREDLQHIAKVIVLNMAIGLLSSDIDNWGHLGGLLGGVAISWLVGPAWKYESTSFDGRRIFSDKAPIFNIIKKNR